MDYLSLGPVPAEEECAQVGSAGYYGRARRECNRHIRLLLAKFGPEPQGAQFKITRNPHDFGDYFDVVISCDPDNREAVEYALRVEADAPSRWLE